MSLEDFLFLNSGCLIMRLRHATDKSLTMGCIDSILLIKLCVNAFLENQNSERKGNSQAVVEIIYSDLQH